MNKKFLWQTCISLLAFTLVHENGFAREGTIPLRITGSILTGSSDPSNRIIIQVPLELKEDAIIPGCSSTNSNRRGKPIGQIQVLESTRTIESICKNADEQLYYLKLKKENLENIKIKGIIRQSK